MISDDSDIGGDERIDSSILYNVTDKCMYYEVEELITVGIKLPSPCLAIYEYKKFTKKFIRIR